jgi:hypothetical protein
VDALKASLDAQTVDREQHRRDVEERLRELEQSRAEAIGELTSLRRDLTDFRLEMREDLQTIGTVLDRIYRNGNGSGDQGGGQ